MLSYDLFDSIYGGGLDSDWLELAGAFQKHVLAQYAGETMTNFTNLEDKATHTSFETFTVIANWHELNTYNTGQHTLPPSGVVAMSTDDTLTAGVFAAYNGVSLSAGDHYLIEERSESDILVRQPLGPDTQLTVKPLPGWELSDSIEVWAYAAAGQVISSVPVTVAAQGITFVYQQQLSWQSVAYYRVAVPCEGDFDGDRDVDGSDLALFAADFGRTDCGSEPPCEGDFDGDGNVDGSDLAVFAADFGRTDCP